MADVSLIEWTDATWNVVTGCTPASPGCKYCFAMRLAGTRLKHHPSRCGLTKLTKKGPIWTGEVRFNRGWLDQPLHWKEPRRVFVIAHGDLGHPGVEPEWARQIFDVMDRAPQHTYQLLTKRPGRVQRLLGNREPRQNWLVGVSVEDQKRANDRRFVASTLAKKGWNVFVSYEPAIGLVDWTGWEFIRWMISGGENGPRPSHPDWFRATRDWCAQHGVAYLHKQNGTWAPGEVIGPNERALDAAWLLDGRWHVERVGKAQPDDHIDDEPEVFHVGKKAAGRLLDGCTHDAYPILVEQAHERTT